MFAGFNKYRLYLVAAWTVFIVISVAWNVLQTKKDTREKALIEARTIFEHNIAYKKWDVMNGGVYVPISDRNRPNPYISTRDRDITASNNIRLTLINHYQMTRQAYEFLRREFPLPTFNRTVSMKPLDPENIPDEWEKKALMAFERGEDEVSEITSINGKEYMRVLKPYVTIKECLKCHGVQGYKVGDIRGGISVAVPFEPFQRTFVSLMKKELFVFTMIWCSGLLLIYAGTKQIKNKTEALHDSEKALRKAKETADAANSAKSAFLANISHEIRTPLNAITGLSDLALKTEDAVSRREYIEMVRDAAGQLHHLVSDVLDLSKIEAGKFEMEKRTFDLNDVIRRSVEAQAFIARRKMLEFKVAVAPSVPGILCGDPVCLGQIITNLVSNAVKFTERGEVVLEVRRADEDSPVPDGDEGVTILFSVRDTGIGIPPGKHEEVFESFSQVDGSVTRKYGGTGLGTTISKKLVELMGGNIRFESSPGRGSVFHFQVRFGLGHAAGEPEQSAVVSRGAPGAAFTENGLNILLAEDNYYNQRLIADSLRMDGHAVTVANDGREAINYWEKGSYDVVLMDIQMPVVSGLQAAESIREIEKAKGGHTRIIAITANALKEDAEKCLRAGIDDYISKPVNMDRLIRKLRLDLNDVIKLENLSSAVRRDIVRVSEYMSLLREDIRGGFSHMERAAADGDAEGLARAAHKIKGTAGDLRDATLYDLALEIEKTARAGGPEDVLPMLAGFRAEFERICRIMEVYGKQGREI